MARNTQISAEVSPRTRQLLEQYSRATGTKKGYLIEQAVLHHIQALQELPADVIIPQKLMVSKASGLRIIEDLSRPAKPTKALRKLMSGNGD